VTSDVRWVTWRQLGNYWIKRGTAASKPAAGRRGRLYVESDSPFKVWYDDGSAWNQVVPPNALQLAEVSTPTTPPADTVIVYVSAATGELTRLRADGSTRSLEAGDMVFQENGTDLATTSRVNFATGIFATADTINDVTTVSTSYSANDPADVALPGDGAVGVSTAAARSDHAHEHPDLSADPIGKDLHHPEDHTDGAHSAANKVEVQVGGTKVGGAGVWRSIINLICTTGWVATGSDTGTRYDVTIAGIPTNICLMAAAGVSPTISASNNVVTEIDGATGGPAYRNFVDLTNARDYRVVVTQIAAGPSSARVACQFSTDGSTWVYGNGNGSGTAIAAGHTAAMSATGDVVLDQDWASLTASLRGEVYVRPVVVSGGTATPTASFRSFHLQVK
jgi:hypothetical protein